MEDEHGRLQSQIRTEGERVQRATCHHDGGYNWHRHSTRGDSARHRASTSASAERSGSWHVSAAADNWTCRARHLQRQQRGRGDWDVAHGATAHTVAGGLQAGSRARGKRWYAGEHEPEVR